MPKRSSKPTYAFIDASNLFYGGEKSLGWKVDYKKLLKYIKSQYGVRKAFYYAGVELCGLRYSPLESRPIDLHELAAFLKARLRKEKLVKSKIMDISRSLQRIKFYMKLESFGYKLKLKPVKIFKDEGGRITKKANCDVDMTFDLMRYLDEYSGALILSGDGDFTVVLKYLKEIGKKVTILARAERTARELKQLAGGDFRDFRYLRELLKFE